MSDNQAVQVLLLDEVGQEPFGVVRQVQISLRRSALAQGLKASIVISSAQHPEKPATVLVVSQGDKPQPQ